MKKSTFTILIVTALVAAFEFMFVHPEHQYALWPFIKKSHLLLGFLGGLVLMGLAKALGKFWLYRREDYYD